MLVKLLDHLAKKCAWTLVDQAMLWTFAKTVHPELLALFLVNLDKAERRRYQEPIRHLVNYMSNDKRVAFASALKRELDRRRIAA